jgi:predicted RNA-binding Zn ribbon-like protein
MGDPTPLVGEPLALDLVNTRPRTASGPVDLIATTAALESWLRLEAGFHPDLAREDTADLAADDIAAVHAVRDHAAVAIANARNCTAPPADTLHSLNEALAAAPSIRELAWADGGIVAAVGRRGTTGERLAARLAEATADLLADPAIGNVRECAGEDCVLLFLPGHPRRQWCSAARCGNRARVARYYERHKQAASPDSGRRSTIRAAREALAGKETLAG